MLLTLLVYGTHCLRAEMETYEGRIIVARQRGLIARLRTLGCSTLDHERMLRIFESTLEIFLDHERTLREHDSRKSLAR
jgi:hypothetical protein